MLSWSRGVVALFPTTGMLGIRHCHRAEDSWSCWVGAGGGFLQTLSGEPHPRRKQSYYLRRFGEGKEFLRDGEMQCWNP